MVTLRRIWPMLLLCAATTMIGYLPMVSRSFPSLTQLALFSVVGLAAAPGVHPVYPAAPASGHLAAAGSLLAVAGGLPRRPQPYRPGSRLPLRARSGSCLAGSGGACALAKRYRGTEPGAAGHSRPRCRPAVRSAGARAGADQVVVRAGCRNRAGERRARRRPAGASRAGGRGLAGFDAPSLALPSVAMQRSRQALLPEQSVLEAALAEAQQGLPFRPGLFTPFVEAIARSRSANPVTYDDIIQTNLGPRLGTLLFPRRGTTAGRRSCRWPRFMIRPESPPWSPAWGTRGCASSTCAARRTG